MDAASRNLEITVLSAENLRLDGKSVKKNAYVIVRVDPRNSSSTRADCEGGSNPSWNEKLTLEMPLHARSITIEVKCRSGSADRVIGTANIPVSDMLGDYTPESYLHFLSYRLRDSRGQRNGIINVSAKVKGAGCVNLRKNAMEHGCSSNSQKPPMGLPADGNNYYGSTVIGVPVWG